MSTGQGWIALYRKIMNTAEWLQEPFTRAQAWIDILLLATHTAHSVRIRGVRIDLMPGQLALSEVEAARRWQWSRGKVRRYLTELASNSIQRIEQQKTNVSTIITVRNWHTYQFHETADGTSSRTPSGQQTDTYNNGNKGNKENNTPPLPPKRERERDLSITIPPETSPLRPLYDALSETGKLPALEYSHLLRLHTDHPKARLESPDSVARLMEDARGVAGAIADSMAWLRKRVSNLESYRTNKGNDPRSSRPTSYDGDYYVDPRRRNTALGKDDYDPRKNQFEGI